MAVKDRAIRFLLLGSLWATKLVQIIGSIRGGCAFRMSQKANPIQNRARSGSKPSVGRVTGCSEGACIENDPGQ
jgi:hypothetical protein